MGASRPWWELEKLYTEKDKEAIRRANTSRWEEINDDWAETEEGRKEVNRIKMSKYHRDEARTGMI